MGSSWLATHMPQKRKPHKLKRIGYYWRGGGRWLYPVCGEPLWKRLIGYRVRIFCMACGLEEPP